MYLGHRLKFDNSYFKHIKEQYDSELLVLETDDVLFKDDGFRWMPPGIPAFEKLSTQRYLASSRLDNACFHRKGVEMLAQSCKI